MWRLLSQHGKEKRVWNEVTKGNGKDQFVVVGQNEVIK